MGASPTGGTTVPIAQLVLEHKIFNLGVLGSNPNGNTKYSLSSVGRAGCLYHQGQGFKSFSEY